MGTQNPNTSGAWQSAPAPEPSKLGGQAERAAEQLASSALETVQHAREKAEWGLSEQRGQITQRIRRVGDALRATSDELRLEDETVADYLEQAGDRVERVATYISSAQPSDLARDVQRFASERPAWFFGGTFLVGLALGRFLKSTTGALSSEPERYEPSFAPARSAPSSMGVTTASTVSVGAPTSGGSYSEPRVYGGSSSNGDKSSAPVPAGSPGSRTS